MKFKLLPGLALVLSATTLMGQGVVPRQVLAFYYPWYSVDRAGTNGKHWGAINAPAHQTSATAQYPARGVYNSMDPAVVRSQIQLAQSNGITGFIVSWFGRVSEQERNDASVPVLLQCADELHFKISIYWEQEPGSAARRNAHAVDDLVYLATQFGTNDAFLKVDGKPVIFVYERVLTQMRNAPWQEILSEARARAGPFLLIADKYEVEHARLFSGLHRYNISWAMVGKTPGEIRAWAAQYDGDGVKLARLYHRISCVTVIPGYNDTKLRKPGRIVDRQDGQLYRVLWEEAIRANPDWVVITSWNEWLEGTEIEPSVEDGDKYLKLTAEYAGQFTKLPPVEPDALDP